jgi:hypothetical protein
MKYKFHPEALQEYREATRWYAEHDLKLAFRFIDAVEEVISRVVENPLRWRAIDERCPSLPHSRFPVRNALYDRKRLHINCGRDAL